MRFVLRFVWLPFFFASNITSPAFCLPLCPCRVLRCGRQTSYVCLLCRQYLLFPRVSALGIGIRVLLYYKLAAIQWIVYNWKHVRWKAKTVSHLGICVWVRCASSSREWQRWQEPDVNHTFEFCADFIAKAWFNRELRMCIFSAVYNFQRTAVSPGIPYISYVDLCKTRVFPLAKHTQTQQLAWK